MMAVLATALGSNSYSFGARMRVARQSGGKSLFASNDGANPTQPYRWRLNPIAFPARATLRPLICFGRPGQWRRRFVNIRSSAARHQYRDIIGQTGALNLCTTTRRPVPPCRTISTWLGNNGAGTGIQSNEIDLTVTPLPPVEEFVRLPGLTKLTDPSGDTSAALGVVSTPAPPGSDLLSFQLAQPFAGDASSNSFSRSIPMPTIATAAGSAGKVANEDT